MSTTKVKVAIIEDDMAIVQMYRTKFETEGYDVATAPDGASGLELIDSFEPDIVLLDLMMPNMNGLDMLSKLRSQPNGRNAKVVVLTNMGDTETATRVYKMAADDYIVKAEMTPKQVAERVKTLLAKGGVSAAGPAGA
ncbi:MAG TPA: response regulator [Candidatus Saccharimonadia bacterium]|nr:response regulator [Candidatus Saccharimonadia bacterium]